MGLKRRRSALLTALAVLILPGFAPGRQIEITILHTADVRGHVFSLRHREHAAYLGGLLRCATVIRKVRAEQPNVLLVDCGDLLMGSPESALSDGTLALEAINALRYDARVPGGKDWIGGFDALVEREHLTRVPMLASNCRSRPGSESLLLNHVQWLERDMDGIRLIVLGMAHAPALMQEHLRMEDPRSAMSKLLPEIRKRKPDVLVLAAHFPFHSATEDVSLIQHLARTYPEVDVVLCGGGGSAVRGAKVGDTLCSQADAQGRWLGRVDMTFDTEKGILVNRSADLIEIGPEIPEDQLLLQALGTRLGRIEHQLETVVGHTRGRIEGSSDWPGQSGVQELVSLSVTHGLDTEVDVVLLGKEGGGYLAEGKISRKDIVRAIPDIRNWARVSVLPSELREILSENGAQVGTPNFMGCQGLRYTAEVRPEGGVAIRDLVLEGDRKPHGRGRLHVLFNADLLEPSRPGRERLRRIASEPRVRLEVLPIDTRQAVADYVGRESELRIRPQRGMAMILEEKNAP